MGTATKAIIRLGTPIEQIEHAILHKYGNVEVCQSSTVGMYYLSLKKCNEIWSMFIDYNTEFHDIPGVYMSSRVSQLSIDVMEYLCQTFGGYLDQNDSDDVPYYSINNDLYLQDVPYTPMDLFRH
jgi:hypothetical protein